MISEYKFLLASAEHMVVDDQKYTPHSFIEKVKAGDNLLNIAIGQVRWIMQELANRVVDMKYCKGNLIYELKPIL